MTAEILIALIGASATLCAACVAGAWGMWQAKYTRTAIGKPNGQGNVVQMQEASLYLIQEVLTNQGRHDEKLDLLNARVTRLEDYNNDEE